MTGYIYQISVQMITVKCINCGVLFGVTEGYQQDRKQDHKSFRCPNGHSQYYPGETDEQKEIKSLKGEVACLTECCDIETEKAKKAEASRRAYKGVGTKLKKAIAGGGGADA